MNPSLNAPFAYRQSEPGKVPALILTLLVHAGLLAFLFFGVQWKQEVSPIEAELWSEIPAPSTGPQANPNLPVTPPEVKAEPKPEPPKPVPPVPPVLPAPPTPPKAEVRPVAPPVKAVAPTPAKPDIALKEDKKKQKETPKPEAPAEKAKPKPEKKPDSKLPPLPGLPSLPGAPSAADELRQVRGAQANAAAEGAANAAARGKSDKAYKARITRKIRGNVTNLPGDIEGNPEAEFVITQLPTGEIINVQLRRSSGNSALDLAVERAIRRSSPLPQPDDPSLFQRQINMKYRPFEH